MYEIVTLDELKSWCKITTTDNDAFFETLRTAITALVENFIGHTVITRSYTEFYNGMSQHRLLLYHYPVYLELDSDSNPSNITLYDDTERKWTSSSLIDPTDYWVEPDCGTITLYDDEWRFSTGVGCIKVSYWAGMSRFLVVSGFNDRIDVQEDGGAEVSVQILAKDEARTEYRGYSAEALAAAIQTALNESENLNGTYTVSYDHVTQKFTISATGLTSLSLLWSSGSNAASSIASLIGFSTSANKTGALSYTSDFAVTGVPHDLRLACQQIALKLWEDSKQGISIQNVEREVLQQGINRVWVKNWIPITAQAILEKYKRIAI